MNRIERAYADHLWHRQLAGEIVAYVFEGIRFRLGHGAYYKPDFLVVFQDRFEIHEVKGHWRDAAKVRAKVAAERYPWFKFIIVYRRQREWQFEEI